MLPACLSAPVQDVLAALLDDHTEELQNISRDNFLTISMNDRKLIVFDDADMFHRSPLTVLACNSIHTRRSIVRMDFYGQDSKGKTVVFRRPRGQAASAWRELETVPLPAMLATVCQNHATTGAPPAGTDAHTRTRSVSAHDALDSYIRGDPVIRNNMRGLCGLPPKEGAV